MSTLIAYCGINCQDCPALKATLADDNQMKTEVAAQWSEQFKANIQPAQINCRGCSSEKGPWFHHCSECNIRACARAKNLPNCALCPDFICPDLNKFFSFVPQAKATLEQVRSQQAK